MKAKHVLMSIICSMLWFAAFGTETEPNDTKAQANKLTLNGSNSGAITPGGDVDWWKITTNNDGMLSLTLTSNGIYLSFQLFDFNGTTAVNSVVNYVSGTGTQNTNGLAKGTYYVKVYATDAGNQPVYTISNSLTVPTEGNDGEPNGSSSQAVTLAQNNSLTGHVGYYYNLKRDTVDWYKVTTNADGQLDLKLTSGNGHYLSLYLYDNNATTQLGGWNYISGTSTLSTNGLAAGTYYFKIYCTDYTYDFAPYTIKDSLILTPVANDAEPNGTKSLALNINIGETKTGHAGYYYNLKRDTADWYKVTTVADGSLTSRLHQITAPTSHSICSITMGPPCSMAGTTFPQPILFLSTAWLRVPITSRFIARITILHFAPIQSQRTSPLLPESMMLSPMDQRRRRSSSHKEQL